MVTIADKIEKINRDYYLATDETTLDSACLPPTNSPSSLYIAICRAYASFIIGLSAEINSASDSTDFSKTILSK